MTDIDGGQAGIDEDTEEETTPQYRADPLRNGIALCLSGGGFRATLYHLGALRCLNDLGVLHRVRTIASVSGGSVTAAFLARTLPWPLQGPLAGPDFESSFAQPLRAFVSRDHRTTALLSRLWRSPVPPTEQFAARLEGALGQASLSDLPTAGLGTPEFVICATNLTAKSLWRFQRSKVQDDQLGECALWAQAPSLAQAVAISACLPPVFPPYQLLVADLQFKDGRLPRSHPLRREAVVDLNDGGTYDNLGLEAVWRDHDIILVSDGGAPMLPDAVPRFRSLYGRTIGSSDLNDQMGRLARRRWFIMNLQAGLFRGAYWGIGNATQDHNAANRYGYPRELVESRIARIRTDLDAFSRAEQEVLENHGYTCAFASAIQWAHGALGLSRTATCPPPPHSDAVRWDFSTVDDVLRDSHRRVRLLPRAFRFLRRSVRPRWRTLGPRASQQ